jgi:hypothetical protein
MGHQGIPFLVEIPVSLPLWCGLLSDYDCVICDAHQSNAMQHSMVTMVTMGGDLQPGCLADRLLTGLGQLQINP